MILENQSVSNHKFQFMDSSAIMQRLRDTVVSLGKGYLRGSSLEIQFIQFLRFHRLEGFLSLDSSTSMFSSIVKQTATKIATRYQEREAFMLSTFHSLKNASASMGIELRPIKTVYLLLHFPQIYYPRFFEDIDIIVPEDSCEKFLEYLFKNSYRTQHSLSLQQALLCLRSQRSLNMKSMVSGVSVDIHTHAIPYFLPGSRRDANFIALPPFSDIVPSNEHSLQLCIMIINIYKNCWSRIDKLIDIALVSELISKNELSLVQKNLVDMGYSNALMVTDLLMQNLFNYKFPDVLGIVNSHSKPRRFTPLKVEKIVQKILRSSINYPITLLSIVHRRLLIQTILENLTARVYFFTSLAWRASERDVAVIKSLYGLNSWCYSLVRTTRLTLAFVKLLNKKIRITIGSFVSCFRRRLIHC
jgi:hypothetical protein